MRVNLLKFAGIFSFLLVIAASCSKNASEPVSDLIINKQTAARSVEGLSLLSCAVGDTTVTGDWAIPPFGNFGTRYSYLGDAGTGNKVSLSGRFNGDLKPESGWTLGFIDGHTGDLCTVSPSVSDSSVTVLGYETGSTPGWYDYSSMVATPIAGRVAILRNTSTSDVYAIRLIEIDPEQNPLNLLQYRGNVTIEYAKIQ